MNLIVPAAMTDTSLAFTSAEDKDKAVKELKDAIQSLQFFLLRCSDETAPARASDVYAHIRLLEHHVAELSRLTGYDGMLLKETEARHVALRTANEKIRELETMLGQAMTGAAVQAGIKHYLGVLGTWWSAMGFRYAKMEPGQWCVSAELSEEIVRPGSERSTYADKTLLPLASAAVQPVTDKGYDLKQEIYHSCVLDTDRNRAALRLALLRDFPNARVSGFQSHRDGDSFLLRTNVLVDYEDLERWEKSLLSKSESAGQKDPKGCTGGETDDDPPQSSPKSCV